MKDIEEEYFDLDVVEFDSGVYLETLLDIPEARELAKQILQDHKKLQEINKCVNETLANIPEHCCYTHDDQREPLEGVKEIIEGKE